MSYWAGYDGQPPPPQEQESPGRETRASRRQAGVPVQPGPPGYPSRSSPRGRGQSGGRGGNIQGYVRGPGQPTGVPRNSLEQNEDRLVFRNSGQANAPVSRNTIGNFVPASSAIEHVKPIPPPPPPPAVPVGTTPPPPPPTGNEPKIPGIMDTLIVLPETTGSGIITGRSGTPVPEEFVPFGENESFSEDVNTDDPMGSSEFETPLAQPFNTKRGKYWNSKRKGGKRKHEGDGMAMEIENKKPKNSGPKTASMLLHEMCKTLVFNFSDMVGPPHDPSFNVTVVYTPNGKEYSATGRSKKIAKQNVAEVILTDLGIPIPSNEAMSSSDTDNSFVKPSNPNSTDTSAEMKEFLSIFTPPPTGNRLDFSSDDVTVSSFNTPEGSILPGSFVSPNVLKRLRNIKNLEENCAAAFNSLISPVVPTYEVLSEEGLSHEKVFMMKLTCKDPTNTEKSFIGRGQSKKLARRDAAKQALICILGDNCYHALAHYSQRQNGQDGTGTGTPKSDVIMSGGHGNGNSEYNLRFADHVANLVIEKYEELMKADEPHLPQKVLAGVIMTTGCPLVETTRVIAVTTGTKCIEGDFMSVKGLALNDCHAEILATRCVRDFLYSELDKLLVEDGIEQVDLSSDSMEVEEEKQSIFEIVRENADGVLKFRLKDDVKFHLYISTSPCGDARIFSPKGIDANTTDEDIEPPGVETAPLLPEAHPLRINRGVLRAKIEAGEGTIPVANLINGPQTWDGILQGNALYTMSCSDKVCRWNVTGMQGALLSNFMDPVFYSSIILGSLHHPVHFKRAILNRIEKLESTLVPPYKVNRPELLMVSKQAKRRVMKSPNHAVTWTTTWSTPEVLSASKGCCLVSGVASRLAKRVHFLRFLKIFKNKTGRREQFAKLSYGDAKLQAKEYQVAKDEFINLMMESGYGAWISKPIEQDSFFMD